jgi:hypothetical protein
MKLHIDFVERRGAAPALLAGAAAALAVALALGALHWQLAGQLGAAAEHVSTLEQQLRARQRAAVAAAAATPQQLEADKAAALATRQLQYPWHRVLAEIEAVQEPRIALAAFSHEQSAASSTLAIETAEPEALLAYLRQLNEDTEPQRWYVATFERLPAGATVRAQLRSR